MGCHGAPLSFLGVPWAPLEVLQAARGMTLTTRWALLVAVGVLWAALGSVLGCSWPTLGRSLGALGGSWGGLWVLRSVQLRSKMRFDALF